MSEFIPFPKLPRLARKCIISEKIDGTNAQVFIEPLTKDRLEYDTTPVSICDGLGMWAGSRTRWLLPEGRGPKGCDNFGFARWVEDNADTLWGLGEGRHFGEWWGQGIQRNYGLTEKRFSLFNAERWQSARPACVSCVPVLYRGDFNGEAVDEAIGRLAEWGSQAAPGFMKPEGIVVYHTASNSMFKRTIEKDAEPKSKAA